MSGKNGQTARLAGMKKALDYWRFIPVWVSTARDSDGWLMTA